MDLIHFMDFIEKEETIFAQGVIREDRFIKSAMFVTSGIVRSVMITWNTRAPIQIVRREILDFVALLFVLIVKKRIVWIVVELFVVVDKLQFAMIVISMRMR